MSFKSKDLRWPKRVDTERESLKTKAASIRSDQIHVIKIVVDGTSLLDAETCVLNDFLERLHERRHDENLRARWASEILSSLPPMWQDMSTMLVSRNRDVMDAAMAVGQNLSEWIKGKCPELVLRPDPQDLHNKIIAFAPQLIIARKGPRKGQKAAGESATTPTRDATPTHDADTRCSGSRFLIAVLYKHTSGNLHVRRSVSVDDKGLCLWEPTYTKQLLSLTLHDHASGIEACLFVQAFFG